MSKYVNLYNQSSTDAMQSSCSKLQWKWVLKHVCLIWSSTGSTQADCNACPIVHLQDLCYQLCVHSRSCWLISEDMFTVTRGSHDWFK